MKSIDTYWGPCRIFGPVWNIHGDIWPMISYRIQTLSFVQIVWEKLYGYYFSCNSWGLLDFTLIGVLLMKFRAVILKSMSNCSHVELTPEQHEFELHRATYTQVFFPINIQLALWTPGLGTHGWELHAWRAKCMYCSIPFNTMLRIWTSVEFDIDGGPWTNHPWMLRDNSG